MCALLALNAIELSFCLESAPASPSTACDTRGGTTLPAQVLLRQRRGETPGAALRRENTQRLPVPGRPPVGRRDRRRRRPRRRHIEPEGPRAARVAAGPFRAPRLGAPRRPRAEQTRMPLRRASIILTIRRGVRGGAAEWLAPGRRRRRRARREARRGAGAEVRAGGRIPPRSFGRPRRRAASPRRDSTSSSSTRGGLLGGLVQALRSVAQGLPPTRAARRHVLGVAAAAIGSPVGGHGGAGGRCALSRGRGRNVGRDPEDFGAKTRKTRA